MAEVLAVVGSIGAIVNIIDAASKAISIIHNLQIHWQDADLTLLSLASQLSAFRAALRRIHEWLESEMPEPHHQLVMDLDETLSFCNILIIKIEGLSTGWESLLEHPTAVASRWKVAFGSKGLDNILVLVERQTNALTLLLTACNCKTMAEQKRLLEKPKTRRVLQRAKADSASLFVHRDTASFMSRVTDNLSKMSLVFDFDPALFSSGVYHRVFRGSLKYRLRQQQHQHALDRLSELHPQHEQHDSAHEMHDTLSIMMQHEPPQIRNSTTWKLTEREGLALVQFCEARMLDDCDRFAALYVKCIAVLDAEHALSYFDDQAGQITRRISQAQINWRDPSFQQLLDGGSSGSLIGGPSMTLCRFFSQQMKALGDHHFQHQVCGCLNTLELAYETASMHRANRSRHTDYSIYTAWSRTMRQSMSDALTVVISVPMAESHYELCLRNEVIAELALSLQPLMYDVKYCSPSKFTFVLLLTKNDDVISRLPNICFPIASHSHSYYLNIVLVEIVRLFRQSNEDTQCDYLTIWDSPQMNERILGAIELVSKKGQVTMENGVLRARLLPMQ